VGGTEGEATAWRFDAGVPYRNVRRPFRTLRCEVLPGTSSSPSHFMIHMVAIESMCSHNSLFYSYGILIRS
jgi:hypothetical protein